MDTINTLLNFLLENGRACEVFFALSLFVGIAIGFFGSVKKQKFLPIPALQTTQHKNTSKSTAKRVKLSKTAAYILPKACVEK